MSRNRATMLALISGAVLALASVPFSPADADRDESGKFVRIDYGVDHISTVPATSGQPVKLFVREVRAGDRIPGARAKVVLFVHGGTVSSVPDFDLQYKDYSWAEYLARAGFDVFMMDHTGYGFSPRPMMSDACNTSPANQAALTPNPLDGPCSPSYAFALTTSQSDRDEIDTVVNWIRGERGVQRVNLVGWSAGVTRIGGYAAQHPDKVEKLFFYAGGASATAPSTPPPDIPRSGVPMGLQSHQVLMNGRWDSEVGCQNQFDPGIRPVLWATIMSFDPMGSTWWTPPWNPIASPAGGVMRTRTSNPAWGWNTTAAAQIQTPSLLAVGLFDGALTGTRNLYANLGTQNKLLIEITCASHFVVWEYQHKVLLEGSKNWFRRGSIKGVRQGILAVDADGRYHNVLTVDTGGEDDD